ncbi:MAG TPA: c-type cytochrome [Burkholderiales bacterium]|nr:c-type cytochrome [Burkholderiales bacterium]
MDDQGFEHAHSSPIKTWRQLVVVIALAFLVPVIGIILLTQFITSDRKADPATLAPEAVAARIQPVARVVFADATAPAGTLKSGEETYKAVCAACHGQGIAGAPKVGDNAAWAPHLKTGLAALVKNAINGVQSPKGVMPPRGGNPMLSDWEITAAIVHMANQSGASFKEPPKPAAAGATAAAAPAGATAPVAVAAPASAAAPATPAVPVAAAAAPDGGALLQKNGCLACHAIDKKVVGPSYKEVAAKYATDKSAAGMLEKKVKAGGVGVWGQIPMPPNAAVSDTDLQAMVKYILALK